MIGSFLRFVCTPLRKFLAETQFGGDLRMTFSPLRRLLAAVPKQFSNSVTASGRRKSTMKT